MIQTDWAGRFLPIIGVTTAAGAALARALDKGSWFEGLASISLLTFWTTFALYVNDARKLQDVAFGMIRRAGTWPTGEHTVLLDVLRAGAFGGCEIEPLFWAYYGREILSDESSSVPKRIRAVTTAIGQNDILVSGSSTVYRLIYELVRIAHARQQPYLATATLLELEDNAAARFILSLSAQFPGTVRRILLLPDAHSLRNLPKVVKDGLAKVNDVVEMRTLVIAGTPPNFGLYGSIAVGELDEKSKSNRFVFRREVVGQKTEEFQRLWQQAEPLTDDML